MKIKDLTEAPITDYEPLGNFERPGAFRSALDKRLVTHPVSVGNVIKFFANTPYDIRIFPCNISGTGKHSEIGEVTHERLHEILGPAAEKVIANSDNAITIVYVGNQGAELMPLTPWIMAHRLGHAINASSRVRRGHSYWKTAEQNFFRMVNQILQDYYNKSDRNMGYNSSFRVNLNAEYCALFNAIGTQRSSAHGLIKRSYEFLYEAFAQYLQTGHVKFNPLPTYVTYGKQAWGRPSQWLRLHDPQTVTDEDRQNISDDLSSELGADFRNVLDSSLGKIFVM